MTDFDFLQGVYNIAPTPFQSDGSLDEASISSLTEFVISKGVNGITILGVMGETSKVSDIERVRIIERFIEAAEGRVPICVGTSHAATGRCVEFSKQAQELGAQAVMVAPPKLSRSSNAALRRHYLSVADAIDIPIVVQDHPASSNVYMDIDFIASVAEEAPLCRYLKLEDEPSPSKVSQVLAANPDVQVFGGLGGIMFLEELRHGAIGTMTGFAFPEILVAIYRNFTEGNIDEATEVFYRYCPLIRFENQARISLALRKHVYNMRGAMATDTVREPYAAIDEGILADLQDLLSRIPV